MIKMLKLRYGYLVAILVGLLLVVSACSNNTSETPANSSENTKNNSTGNTSDSEDKPKDKIVVAVPFGGGAPGGIPIWVGEKLGFFEEEGLEVEVQALNGRPAEAVGMVVA